MYLTDKDIGMVYNKKDFPTHTHTSENSTTQCYLNGRICFYK